MPTFERLTVRGSDRIAFEAEVLIMAGWTGRDQAAVQQHIEELGALGVPPPSRTPLYYRLDPALLCTAPTIDVLGQFREGLKAVAGAGLGSALLCSLVDRLRPLSVGALQ